MANVNSLVETKVAAGSATVLISGYIAWALITFVDNWQHTIPMDLQAQLPFIIAWFLSSTAAYLAPHTHRPDLLPAAPSPAGKI